MSDLTENVLYIHICVYIYIYIYIYIKHGYCGYRMNNKKMTILILIIISQYIFIIFCHIFVLECT